MMIINIFISFIDKNSINIIHKTFGNAELNIFCNNKTNVTYFQKYKIFDIYTSNIDNIIKASQYSYILYNDFKSLYLCHFSLINNIPYYLCFDKKFVNSSTKPFVKKLIEFYCQFSQEVFISNTDYIDFFRNISFDNFILIKHQSLKDIYPPTKTVSKAYDLQKYLMCNNSIDINQLKRAIEVYKLDEDSLLFMAYGGQGAIYKAYSISLKKYILIKLPNNIHNANVAMLNIQKEKKIYRKAMLYGIKNLPIIYKGNSGHYMAKEYIQGLNIEECLELQHKIEMKVFFEFTNTIFNFFHYTIGYVIEDFKASNIIWDTCNLRWVLVDTGSAKKEYNTRCISNYEQPVAGNGRFFYCSPELLLRKYSLCDKRIDYFCLGVLCYRILLDDFPYKNNFKEDMLMDGYIKQYSHIKENLNIIRSKYSDSFIDFVIGCLDPDVDKRVHKLIDANLL